MKTRKKTRVLVVLLLLVSFISLQTAGCYGRFELTRKVYHFNQRVDDDKWIQWIVFLPLTFGYVIGIAVDLVFGNPVEFWTGVNPISAGLETSRLAYGPNGEVVRVTRMSQNAFSMEVTESSLKSYSAILVHENEEVCVYTPEGNLIARVSNINGSPELLTGSQL